MVQTIGTVELLKIVPFPISLALASLDQKAEIYIAKAVCLHFSIRQYDDLCVAWKM